MSFDHFSYPAEIWCDFRNDASSHQQFFPFLTSVSKTLVCYVNSAVEIAVSHIHHMLGEEVLHLLQLLYAYPHACFSALKVKVKKIIVKKNKNIFTLRRNRSTPQASLVFYCTVLYTMLQHKNPLTVFLYNLCLLSPLTFKKDTCKRICTPKLSLNGVSRGSGK